MGRHRAGEDAGPTGPAGPGCVEGHRLDSSNWNVWASARTQGPRPVPTPISGAAPGLSGTRTRPRRISPRPRNTRQSLTSPCAWPTSRQRRVGPTSTTRAAPTSTTRAALTSTTRVGPTLVPVSALTATRSAPHGARFQVAPHHRCLFWRGRSGARSPYRATRPPTSSDRERRLWRFMV